MPILPDMEPTSSGPNRTDARSAPRFPIQWPVELKSGDGRTRDISATGIYLESDVALEQSEQLHFSVLLPHHNGVAKRLHCEGRAVRVERHVDGWWGAGIALQEFQFGSLGLSSI